jgi:hypothetical protein
MLLKNMNRDRSVVLTFVEHGCLAHACQRRKLSIVYKFRHPM